MLAQKIIFHLLKHCFFSFQGIFFTLAVQLAKLTLGLSKTLTLLLLLEEQLQRCFLHQHTQCLHYPLEKLKDKNVLLVTAEDEKWSVEIRQQLIDTGAQCEQGFIDLLKPELTQEQEQRFFSQGIDWQVEHFPSRECFDYIVISPALSYLGHRAMFLRWLNQRYRCKSFIVQLPALQQSVYQQIRLYRGQCLTSRHPNDKIVYQKPSLELDFGLWYRLEDVHLLKKQGLYEVVLQKKMVEQQEYSSPFFSIIIPVYNVEEYLENCLESILAQTFNSFEVLLVNDASPDNSQKIIDAYTAKDTRFRSLMHQHNQGQGCARNTAMKVAIGRYFFFLDSDDFLHPVCLETLAYFLKYYPYQGIGFNSYQGGFLQSVPGGNSYLLKKQVFNSGAFANSYYTFSPWSRVIKREKKINYFPKNHLYEDVVFSSIISLHLKQFLFIPLHLYYYRIRSQSTMQSSFNWKQIADHCFMLKSMGNFFTNRLASTLPLEFFETHLNFLYNKLATLAPKERQLYTLRMWRLPSMEYQKWFDHLQLKNDFKEIFQKINKNEEQAFSYLKKIRKKVKMYQKRKPQLQINPLFELFVESCN